ncbi:PilN domain-containing protein [Rhizobium sp. NLR17b]|uniref:PilN domain-containing protein n=1 Tax=Rhizobium sp. NLR17b TaxID=2731114 RepID=UPI001C8384D7|nr:PilN domain-containing protein [Rhizobium sp. NLR17b]MBX5268656.1 PilN domain-containing protein [Rhizobium sp. NLR17b]
MIVDSALDFRDWWCAEIRRMLFLRPQSRHYPIVEIGRSGVSVIWPDGSRADVVSLAEIETILGRGRTCSLVLAKDRYIRRMIAKSKLPYSRAREIAAADLTAATPFRHDDVYLMPITGNASEGTTYAIVKKPLLDPVVSALTAAKIKIGGISLAVSDGSAIHLTQRAVSELLPKAALSLSHSTRTAITLSLLLLAAGLTLAHAVLRYEGALSDLESEIAAKREQASAVRASLNERAKAVAALDTARRRKDEAVPVIQIWEEMSRQLPDTAWLSDMSIDEETVTMSGFSQSAASLIGPLEESQLFSEPSFTSPVVREAGGTDEHFEMRLKVERK